MCKNNCPFKNRLKSSLLLYLSFLIVGSSLYGRSNLSNNYSLASYFESTHTYSSEIEGEVQGTMQLAVIQPIPNAKAAAREKKRKKGFVKKIKERIVKKKIKKLLSPLLPQDSLGCDIIILQTGEKIEARVLEINTGAIIYEFCYQEDKPKRSVLKSKVFMIDYADGTSEVFKTKERSKVPSREEPDRTVWFIGFALGFLIGLLGLLLAYLIYRKDYIARKKAIQGALVGILAIVLLYLYLLSLI